MDQPDKDDLTKLLEAEGVVPEYLKTKLIAEIELIKDTLQVVSHFGGVFFLSAMKALTSSSLSDKNDE